MNPNLTAEQLRAAQTEIFDNLKGRQAQLEQIRGLNIPLMEKWARFLIIILPIQLRVIKALGFDDNQAALSNFNEQFIRQAEEDPSLRELNNQKWKFLLEKAFGVTEFKELSLEEARTMIEEITEEMTSDAFLEKLDAAVASLKDPNSLIEKRQLLLSMLFPLQMSVMEKHGFAGEKGYVQAQRALMEFHYDPIISGHATRAQTTVFKRIKLL
jgi:hypothetical protein